MCALDTTFNFCSDDKAFPRTFSVAYVELSQTVILRCFLLLMLLYPMLQKLVEQFAFCRIDHPMVTLAFSSLSLVKSN